MSRESTQKKLSRNKPPRVQITYDVEVGDAIETKEIPFVLGVLGDFSADTKTQLPRLKDRKFVHVDKDNFDEVLKGMSPRLAMQVDNNIQEDGSQLGVELEFNEMEDFEPHRVADRVDPIRKLVEARQRLSDLKNKMIGNERLEELLEDVLKDTEKLQAIQAPDGGAK